MAQSNFVQYCCYGALAALAFVYLVPVGLLMGVTSMTTSSIDNLAGQMTEMQFGEGNTRYDRGRIASGGRPSDFKRAYKRLLNLAALPGEAARNTNTIHVGLISFKHAPVLPGEPPKVASAFTPVSLDVTEISGSGLVLVADSPIHWNLRGATSFQRAKLAFEGRAPFDAMNVPQGFIAGIKTPITGDRNVTGPSAYDADPREFCRSMVGWADFFSVPPDSVIIWRVGLPVQDAVLSVNDWGFSGPFGGAQKLGSAQDVCAGHFHLKNVSRWRW